MTKKIWLIASLAIVLPLCMFGQEFKYTIDGKIGDLSFPAKAYLFIGEKMDSAECEKGRFHFTGTISEPRGASLLINKRGTGVYAGQIGLNPYPLRFYIEPGTIKITSPDSIQNAQVAGGQLNADYRLLKARLRSSDTALKRFSEYVLSASDESRKSEGYAEYCRQQFQSIGGQQKQVFLEFINDHPQSPMSLIVLKCYGGFDYSMLSNNNPVNPSPYELDSLLNTLAPEVQDSKPGREFRNLLARLKRTAVGYMAADFSQPDSLGRQIFLHEFRGKYVLIDFWASWCGPCREENPSVVKAYQKYRSKGFAVLSVSLDNKNGRSAWLKAIRDDQLDWTQVSDLKGWSNDAALLYGVNAIPQNFLIDPDGKIVAKNLRGDQLEQTLDNLINK